jgi:hypothetical protein
VAVAPHDRDRPTDQRVAGVRDGYSAERLSMLLANTRERTCVDMVSVRRGAAASARRPVGRAVPRATPARTGRRLDQRNGRDERDDQGAESGARVRETRAAGHRWLVALGLTVGAGALLAGAVGLALAGELLIGRIVGAIDGGWLVGWLLGLGRWVLTGGLLLIVAALVYWAAPNVRQPFKWATPGALLFGAGWLAATWLLRQYTTVLGGHTVYGALGGVWVVLVWFLVVATLLVLGGELNAALDDRPSLRQVGERLWSPSDAPSGRHAA